MQQIHFILIEAIRSVARGNAFSPLTPALSPLRGEGVAPDAPRASVARRRVLAASTQPLSIRRFANGRPDSVAPNAERVVPLTCAARRAPSPLNGERAGVRGEAVRLIGFQIRQALVARLTRCLQFTCLGLAALLFPHTAPAAPGNMIPGISGTTINLSAKDGYISTPDGNSIYCWGFATGDGLMQYPGPTIILNQGQLVTINLTNTLSVPVSILFPGQSNVVATGGSAGLVTREADPNGGTVSYSFVAHQPGTFLYNSGTRMDLQIEMGLVGALIVRPAVATQAYAHANTAFTHENLFLLTEIDPRVHDLVDLGRIDEVDTADFFPVYWFINGRCSPDTMAEPNVSWLPHQPYNCMPRMKPGEKLLLRFIGAGRDAHPFHHHGNNSLTIARDGRMLESAPGLGPDLADSDFTVKVTPGGTADAIFEWTGAGLGWDMYGHAPGDPLKPFEDPADHGKPLPVKLPLVQDVALGETWSGSPFLGKTGFLPPSQVLFNPGGAFFHMWHSHNEKEIVNNDIFPGGMMTMLMIDPW